MNRYLPDFIVIAFYATIFCLLVATANTIVQADGMSEQDWSSAEINTEEVEKVNEEHRAQLHSLNEERLRELIDQLQVGQTSAEATGDTGIQVIGK